MTTAAPLTPAEVAALPAMPTALQAFAALNIGETLGYELIKQGQFPIEVLRFGRAFRVRKSELLAYLGLPELVAAEVQSAAATNSDAPGVQPGAPVEQPAPTSK
ncbi:helix-turn-helix domain-containing protein [Streptomyces sp. AC04842]|uniref:helix-turn-helix domain-containing protein n=1 Tax=Streptomyces sp. AC04842 TaxID=2775327 RepID=UPI0020C690C2|nr:helix-turn-helix domain-containing protein [Streptomyces sp. AC04842]